MTETFLDLLQGSASTIALGDRLVTGREVAASGRALAADWAAAGLRPGDRVGLWMANGRRYLDGLAAVGAGGFVAVSVNIRSSRSEAETLLRRSGARWLRSADGDQPLTSEDAAGTVGPEWAAPLAEADHPFVIFTTSGTTSRPKMVLHSQRSIVVHSHAAAAGFGYRHRQVHRGRGVHPGLRPVLVAMPLCGVFGFASFCAALAGDAPIVMPSAIDPIEIARRVEHDRIWALNGSDDLFHRMLTADADLSSLKMCGYARFNTSLDGIVERAQHRGMTLTGLYGMSEVQALLSVRRPAGDAAERRKAGGTVVSSQAAARVVDDELQLRGPSLFAGYLAEGGASIDQALTAAAFSADGWFRTGDAAVMEEPIDGRSTFHYQARMGDVLRLGGFLVSPAEIESVLVNVPGVAAAQVVAVARPTGARPVAFVVLDRSDISEGFHEQAAIEHCQARLAKFKVPVRVLPIEDFPTTPSANGTKIQKIKLRELAAVALEVT